MVGVAEHRQTPMTTGEQLAGKFNAAKTLWRMMRHLHNWKPVMANLPKFRQTKTELLTTD